MAEQLARLRRGDVPTLPDGPQAHRLMALLPGEVRATPHGECFVVVHRYDLDARHGDRPLLAALERAGGTAAIAGGDADLRTFDLRRALFVDLETTGLARAMGTLPFLIGAAHVAGDQLVLEQWLLRDPDDEPAALADFGARLADADHLVTYNGRAFDLPLLQVRYRGLGLGDPSADLAGHFDLLTAVRRLLKHRLPDCRLATVERHLLGLTRVDDAPGSEAPRRYRGYLFGDDPAPLLPIVAHNRDDILSMVTLVDALLDRVERVEGGVLHDPDCALGLARQAERAGEWAFAARVYAAAASVPEAAERARRGAQRVARRVARERPS
ncbi:MAG: ribonuclease H-like domain-containing protein [Myxococcales bacterium]|nr:ribonuclease H-like domain-containing protein [Myxococcales bacterium]